MDTLVSKKFFVAVLALLLVFATPLISKASVGEVTGSITMVAIAFIGGQSAVDAVNKYRGIQPTKKEPQVNLTVTPKITINDGPGKEVVSPDQTPEELQRK